MRVRNLSESDFECVRNLANRNRTFDPVLNERLREEYRLCVNSTAGRSIFIDSLDSRSSKPSGVLNCVFVNPEFTEEVKTAREPYVCRRLVNWVESGRDPFPSPERMAELNAAEGVDLLVVQWAVDANLPLEPLGRAKRALFDLFVKRHGGWKLRWLLAEACYADLHEYLEQAGLRRLNEHSDWFSRATGLDPGFRPVLLGIDRKGSRATIHGTILSLFAWSDPRCRFSPEQLKVLDLLQQDLTNVQIREQLGVGESTVLKHWSRISSEIERAYSIVSSNHGAGKRSFIEAFLAEHPYELRPWDRATSRGRAYKKGGGFTPVDGGSV